MTSTTLEEYAAIVLSIMRLCEREKKANGKTYKKLHSWYLYRQAFYGFIEYIDWNTACWASERALEEYRKMEQLGDIRSKTWYDQPNFDEGRQGGKFHLEHIYTGDMFRRAVEVLPEENRTANNIARLIQDNYRVAWILKEEDKMLPKTHRGETLEDAVAIYAQSGIHLQREADRS